MYKHPPFGVKEILPGERWEKPRCCEAPETQVMTATPHGGGLTPPGIISRGLLSSTSRVTWVLSPEKDLMVGRVADAKALVFLSQSTEAQTDPVTDIDGAASPGCGGSGRLGVTNCVSESHNIALVTH